MSHDDFESEPIPGLPARLPEGEHIVWQGAPNQAAVRRSVLHTRKIWLYFAIIFVWNVGTAIYDGKTLGAVITTAVGTAILASAFYGLARWFARAVERSTVYTITNKRVVMRFGVALPITFNFPFKQIAGASVQPLDDGNGVIALSLKEHTKISWVILWPHARPWKFAKPQPALRAISDAANVSKILADALRAENGHNFGKASAEVTRQAGPKASTSTAHRGMGHAMPVAHS